MKEKLLKAGLKLAKKVGYRGVSRAQVCKAVGLTPSGLNYYFDDMSRFRSELLRYAHFQGCSNVVAQGLLLNDPALSGVGSSLRSAILTEAAQYGG